MAALLEKRRAAEHAAPVKEPLVERIGRGPRPLYRATYLHLGLEAQSHSPTRASLYLYLRALGYFIRAIATLPRHRPEPLPESRAVGMRAMDLSPEEAAELHDHIRSPRSLPARPPRRVPTADSAILR